MLHSDIEQEFTNAIQVIRENTITEMIPSLNDLFAGGNNRDRINEHRAT